MPNKLSQFLQELKRRNVLRSLAVYTGTAFVILEAADILFTRWGLPDWTFNLVLYLLIFGAFISIVVSWIFDVTATGIEKTKPVSEIREGDKPVVSAGWKMATIVSIIVIIGLVTFNIVGGEKGLRPGDIQSLVILPFDNFTGDDQLDYVADGLHASLIGDVGKIGSLRVISKTTASVYKNMGISLPQIAEEANAEVIIEPSVMCYGDSVCIQIKVMTMYPEEKQLWVGDYKEDKSQILNLYKRITKQIADEMMVELTPEAERLLAKSRTVHREAFDAYLRGFNYIEDLGYEPLIKARDLLNDAIEKDPDWAPLYAALAAVWESLGTMGFESPSVAFPIVYTYLDKALEMDQDLVEAHYLSAFMAMAVEWDWEKAEKEFLKALAINPNHAISRMHYSILLFVLQRPEEGLVQANVGYRLDPLNPLIQTEYAGKFLMRGDCASALDVLENVIASDPDNFYANNIIELASFRCGDLNRVFEAAKHTYPLEEKIMDEIEKIYYDRGFYAAYEEIARQMEIIAERTYVSPVGLAFTYYMINQDDKAVELIEKGAEVRDPNIVFLSTDPYFTRLFDNPRFIDIVEKMNLPLPDK